MEKVQQISVKGILCRDNKVLVLKTANRGRYELPGGRMEFGETAEQAFRREMSEELGFTLVKMGDLVNVWSFTNIKDGTNYHYVILDFQLLTGEGNIKISSEHTEYKWIGLDEIDSLNMREGHKKSLRKFFEKIRKTS